MRGKWGKDVCYKVLLIKRSTAVYVLIIRRSTAIYVLLHVHYFSLEDGVLYVNLDFLNNQVLNLFCGHFWISNFLQVYLVP